MPWFCCISSGRGNSRATSPARSVSGPLPDHFTEDDCTGPAEVALLKLAERFDPARKVPFQVFARRRIYGACLDSVRRREYKERSHHSIDPTESTLARSQGPTPEEVTLDIEASAEKLAIWAYVQELPSRHALVILGSYAGEMTLVESAELLDGGPARVRQ